MIKRLILALALMVAATASHAAGTIAFSLSQQSDQFGKPLSGCLLYTIQAGTTSTPQNSYKDTALTLPQPNPMVCDAFGRLPQFFLADGQIKIRLTDKLGNPVLTQDNILVIGPSAGGGGGGSIDPTTVAATGDVKVSYSTQTLSGWVRMNGRTIGNAVSGATERANADTQALFVFLWNTDPNLVVAGGRGASALADYNSNHQITLPDLRGRALAGLDDMGGTDSGRLSFSGLTSCRFTVGCAGGEGTHTLTASEIPSIASVGTASVTSGSGSVVTGNLTTGLISGGTGAPFIGLNPGGTTASGALSSSGLASVSSNNTGGGAHNNMQPTMLTTFYIKL